MNMLKDLFDIYDESCSEFERLMRDNLQTGFIKAAEYGIRRQKKETYNPHHENGDRTGLPYDKECIENSVVLGDNLEYMLYLINECDMAGRINLIYIDPPFFSKSDYESIVQVGGRKIKTKGFNDSWHSRKAYLKMLCLRLFAMKELLSDTGSIWVHLDWHVVHYVKILMDAVFGEKNFINEVIWTYKSGGTSSRRFARKHDTLLFYGKTKDYYFNPVKEKSYNRDFKPYRFKGVAEYEDEIGWYTLVNKKDVWSIDMVGRTSRERTGYATQKPIALLEQIIECCTKPGDICADFFAGSGVLAKAASRKGRKFLSCDVSGLAVKEHIIGLDRNSASVPMENSLGSEETKAYDFPAFRLLMDEKEYRFSMEDNARMVLEIGEDCEIKSFLPPVDELVIKEEDLQWIKNAAPEDLVACISQDCNYDGRVHRSAKICIPSDTVGSRQFYRMEFSEIRETQVYGKDNFLLIDIFGNLFFRNKIR